VSATANHGLRYALAGIMGRALAPHRSPDSRAVTHAGEIVWTRVPCEDDHPLGRNHDLDAIAGGLGRSPPGAMRREGAVLDEVHSRQVPAAVRRPAP
jgi:hypothetical protein